MTNTVLTVAKWVVATVVCLGLIAIAVVAWMFTRAQTDTVGELDFANELAIPPLLEPTTDQGGTKVFDLTLAPGLTELLPGTQTETWGANGSYLGPTLRASRGDAVRVRVANQLPEATTLHWHGMHLPGAMDGGPHQMIAPADVWEPEWTIDQPAATLWYHPHLHHQTAEHVWRGVAGLFILDDEDTGRLALPSSYGVDDIPLVVQDKRFEGDGSLSFQEGSGNLVGLLGDEILVNGTHDPHLEVHDRRVRLRMLNASNARVYNFGFDDNRAFSLVGTDSGLLPAPVELTRLQLSPGERAELVIDVEPGERTILRSYPPDLGMGMLMERTNGGDDMFDVLEVRAADQLRDSPPVPRTLAEVEPLMAGEATTTRSFELTGFSLINGQSMAMNRIDQHIERGSTEIWEVHNNSNTYHNFHVHLVHFQVLDVDGRPPPPHLAGWKDTVFVFPGTTVRFIATFDTEPDPQAPFMYHCHVLQHEDLGMMGQFVITEANP